MTSHPYAIYMDTPLWRALSAALDDLEGSREIAVHTGRDYVIGYLCQELSAKWIVASASLTQGPKSG